MTEFIHQQTYDALMRIPVVEKMQQRNEKLEARCLKYKHQIQVLTDLVVKLAGGVHKNPNETVIDLTEDEDEKDENDMIEEVLIKQEPNIVYEIIETNPVKNIEKICTTPVVVDVEEKEEVEVVEEKEVEVVEEKEVEVVEEEEEVEEVEEVEVEEEEVEVEEVEEEEVEEVEEVEVEEEEVEEVEVEEEEVEVEEEEVEVVEEEEEEVVEEEEVEVVEEEEEAVEEEEEEVTEVTIKGKKYYTNNEQCGTIYAIDVDGDVGDEIGVFKNGKAVFHAK